jgi:hypothetical protein
MSTSCGEAARAFAAAEGIDYQEFIDALLHWQWCLDDAGFRTAPEGAAGNIHWHREHRRAIQEERYTGARYDPALDIREIKRLVLAEVGETLPGVRVTARTRRWPSGLAVTVRSPRPAPPGDVELVRRIEEIARQYNFDHGDLWTDHFHVNFSLNVLWPSADE